MLGLKLVYNIIRVSHSECAWEIFIMETSTAFHTKKCNSQRISIQWFHIKHCSGYQYTKIQPYQSRVHFFGHFARYAISVPQLLVCSIKDSSAL